MAVEVVCSLGAGAGRRVVAGMDYLIASAQGNAVSGLAGGWHPVGIGLQKLVAGHVPFASVVG